jgi:hypothetical protein
LSYSTNQLKQIYNYCNFIKFHDAISSKLEKMSFKD